MAMTNRKTWVLGAVAAALLLTIGMQGNASAQAPGKLDEAALGNMLRSMGLKPVQEKKRFDFRFKAVLKGEEWELSMSTVLSQNGESIWVMAWLDELPKSAADVPRTALLRLLANNDRLGKGKFFAYIAANRRFVLQRVVANEKMSTAAFREVLKDLGATVVVTYPHWSVDNWKNGGVSSATTGAGPSAPTRSPAATRSTTNSSKFEEPRRN